MNQLWRHCMNNNGCNHRRQFIENCVHTYIAGWCTTFCSIAYIGYQQWSLWWRHNGSDGISNHQPYDCLLNRLFGRRSKKTSKLRVTGLCVENSPGTDEFPAQMASNAKSVSFDDVIMMTSNFHITVPLWEESTGDRKAECHYNDVTMSAMVSQITPIWAVCSAVCSGAHQRKHQSSASLSLVRGIHRWPVDSPHKGPVTRKCYHLMTSSCWEDFLSHIFYRKKVCWGPFC